MSRSRSDRLERRDLVLRASIGDGRQRELIFKHILTRDVAYESLPRRDRPRHEKVAGWIERSFGARRASRSPSCSPTTMTWPVAATSYATAWTLSRRDLAGSRSTRR